MSEFDTLSISETHIQICDNPTGQIFVFDVAPHPASGDPILSPAGRCDASLDAAVETEAVAARAWTFAQGQMIMAGHVISGDG